MKYKQRKKLIIPGYFNDSVLKQKYKLEYSNKNITLYQHKEFINDNNNLIEENLKYIKYKYKEKTKEFYIKLDKELPHVNKNYFNKNINETQILNCDFEDELLGFYDIVNKELKIKAGDCSKFNHELLHLSSSIYDKEKEIIYSGFEQYNKNNGHYIGRGITEGYTEILEQRYFKEHNVDEYNFYFIEQELTKKLEYFIGKTKMEQAYFNANLKIIINELKKYSSIEESIKFIKIVDFIHNERTKENQTLKDKSFIKSLYNIANKYLLKVYIKKLKLNSIINNMSIEEIEDKIIDYYNENNVKIREDEIICNKLTKETYLKYAFKYFKELTNEFTDIFTKSNRTSRK